jgi:Transglutaminase elicitor
MKKLPFGCALLGCMLIVVAAFGAPAYAAYTDSAQVPSGWAVWSCWYWPWVDYLNPNLYDSNEAMDRYDHYDSGAQSKLWEYNNHGPNVPGVEDWFGHCHAWSGAACWEEQPASSRTLSGVQFRVRDRKGLVTETYYGCADGTHNEIYVGQPSPGLFWRYLRQEIGGVNPIHGHAMAFIGELYYDDPSGSQVWNYPVFAYSIDYNYSGSQYYGTMTIYVAMDGDPTYADSTALNWDTFVYQFSGVQVVSGEPINSGTWIGSGHYYRPDCIWRPYYATQWMTYVENSGLDETHLANILNPSPAINLEGILELLLLN